jgi:hypothetical protein
MCKNIFAHIASSSFIIGHPAVPVTGITSPKYLGRRFKYLRCQKVLIPGRDFPEFTFQHHPMVNMLVGGNPKSF